MHWENSYGVSFTLKAAGAMVRQSVRVTVASPEDAEDFRDGDANDQRNCRFLGKGLGGS